MTQSPDFERAWLNKFRSCLEQIAGTEVAERVMAGSQELSTDSSRADVIDWSRLAMQRLDDLVEEGDRRDIMTGCACQYPEADLAEVRAAWETSQDLDLVHAMLQVRFQSFLGNVLRLEDDLIQEIVSRGWGLAGVREGSTILATKIPKSSYLASYFQETDPGPRRQYYCHCPRVRDVLRGNQTLSPTYCYCGAGYYKGIWEEILQQSVKVELLQSVLQGDAVCQVAVYLPL